MALAAAKKTSGCGYMMRRCGAAVVVWLARAIGDTVLDPSNTALVVATAAVLYY